MVSKKSVKKKAKSSVKHKLNVKKSSKKVSLNKSGGLDSQIASELSAVSSKRPKPVFSDEEFSKKNELFDSPNDEKKSGRESIAQIAEEIRNGQIKKQREPIVQVLDNERLSFKPAGKQGRFSKSSNMGFIKMGIDGLDSLLNKGIPRGNSILIAGGAGSGKTILCLQTLMHHALDGRRCLYMSFEEPESKLIQHMEDFGWPAKELIRKNKLRLVRMNPFDITRNVDALLAKEKGELLIDLDPIITPADFSKPDILVIDSLTAIGSAFAGKDESYRIYIEQLFRFLEKTGATSFLITETEQIPKVFSQTGVEEFLADGVIVLYNLKHENVRENAIEVLKLRGAAHKKTLVAMQITNKGIVVYPEQEVFSEV